MASEMGRFGQVLAELRARPRMFVLDDGYVTLVAFIDGLALGVDAGVLDGFREWVARETTGALDSRHWSVIVAAQVSNGVRDGSAPLSAMSQEEQVRSSAELFNLLTRFLDDR